MGQSSLVVFRPRGAPTRPGPCRHPPLCLIGGSVTGKSHLLIALGTEAAMAGYRVEYVLATKHRGRR